MPEPRRTIDLLWRQDVAATAARRGRRPGLTVDRVVATAIVLADAEGLDAVTMRRVAQELGVVPMTLYTYVPDKAALLDLMLDRLYLDMPRAPRPDRPWRGRLPAHPGGQCAPYHRHSWAARPPPGRPT